MSCSSVFFALSLLTNVIYLNPPWRINVRTHSQSKPLRYYRHPTVISFNNRPLCLRHVTCIHSTRTHIRTSRALQCADTHTHTQHPHVHSQPHTTQHTTHARTRPTACAHTQHTHAHDQQHVHTHNTRTHTTNSMCTHTHTTHTRTRPTACAHTQHSCI